MAIDAFSPRRFDFFSGLSNPWSSRPDDTDEDVVPPDVFMPNIPKGFADENGHYETNRSRSNAPYAPPITGPTIEGTREYQDLSTVGNKLSAAYSAPHAGMMRQVLGAMFARKNPALGGVISGETQRQQQIEPLQQQYGMLSDIISKNRAAHTADITNRLHEAQAEFYGPRTQALLNPPPKPTLEESAIQDLQKQVNPDTQKPYTPSEAYLKLKQDVQDTKAPKAPSEEDKAVSDLLAAKKLPDTPANRDHARSLLKTRDRPPKDPEVADIALKLKKAQLEKLKEATPDEQRRADLADNLDENLTQLESIARRRPELFGPLAGRGTTARQWIGTSDPDVAALKNIEEQTGLAMVGAHAMRNAQHAEKAAQSITGANKNTAAVLLSPNGPIATARKSLATFRADVNRRRNAIESATGTAPGQADFGDAGGKPEGSTGTLNGKKVIVKGGRIVAQ